METPRKEMVGVFGKTGAGKSSLINAIIGAKNLLPSGRVTACTSVVTKVEANEGHSDYVAEIEFITKKVKSFSCQNNLKCTNVQFWGR